MSIDAMTRTRHFQRLDHYKRITSQTCMSCSKEFVNSVLYSIVLYAITNHVRYFQPNRPPFSSLPIVVTMRIAK